MVLAEAVAVRMASVAEVFAAVIAVPHGATLLMFVVAAIVASMSGAR